MPLFFEEIALGDTYQSLGTFTVEREEMIAFAKRWDQLPMHQDDAEANKVYGDGGVTASGAFVMAISIRLAHQLPEGSFPAAVASFGYDEVRFHGPVRAGDILRYEAEWVDKRDSRSRPECGIATVKCHLINQDDVTVNTRLDTVLVRRRNPPEV